MGETDKGSGVDRRVRRTERAVIAAARALFERQGYAATTMSQIAQQADCAERTLFLRFNTKALLLKRVVDDTFMGLTEGDQDVRAPRQPVTGTLQERLHDYAEDAAIALVRTGPMFAVAREAEASEPVIAAAFDAARRDTIAASHRMWQHLANEGLLDPAVDIAWVADTTGLLASADAYLLIRTTMDWSRQDLAAWLERTWTYFATTPST
jgi:AcrR family transcriptional regulator